jgi:serine/threonine protein kinase
MDAIRHCPSCGKPLAPNGPMGLCTACLMEAGFPSGTESETGNPAQPRPPSFTPPQPGDLARRFPQLEILELIGQGGMGAVYKARQKELDRVVALKILPPGVGDAAFAERFAREAKALARLNHPGIVTIYEFGNSNGLFFFLMEYVDGATLRQVLQAGPLSPREALAIVPAICDALQYAHDQGIVHRDIKPDNILLDRRGRTKVADFGLAKLMESGSEDSQFEAAVPGASSTMTRSNKMLGTPQYMAPEQVEHPAAVDHRADIYALGVVFYQMLTGELPGQRIEPPSRKVQIDVRLDEVVLRALEKNPALRYAQAGALKTDVETIAMTEQLSSAPPHFPQSAVARHNAMQWLARLLPALVNDSRQRAARIQAVETHIVLPIRFLIVALLCYYFFFAHWFDTPSAASASEWTLKHATMFKEIFVAYALLSLALGTTLIWSRQLSLQKILWIAFAMGITDGAMLGVLTFLTEGFGSEIYWVFLALVARNAVAIPLALPQLLLNFLASLAFLAGGLLAPLVGGPPEENSWNGQPSERMIVLMAWSLWCYGIQWLFEKQKRAEPQAIVSPRDRNG